MRSTAAMHLQSSATSRPLAFPQSNHSLISTSPKCRFPHQSPCPISPSASSSATDTACSCMASQALAKLTSPLPSVSRRVNSSKKSLFIVSPTLFNAFGMPQLPKIPASSNASTNSISSSLTNSVIHLAIRIPSSYFSISLPITATKKRASSSHQTVHLENGFQISQIHAMKRWQVPPSTVWHRIPFCSHSSVNHTAFCSPN